MMEHELQLSVVICSWNRGRMLEETLVSVLAAMEGDHRRCIEVIVVDNASTDDTAARLSRYQDRIRVHYEGSPGLSNARNAGVRLARGAWILFLDDDVYLEDGFFSAYQRAFRAFPQFDFWAAPVLPVFDGEAPSWVEPVLRAHPWCFSALDLGGETRALAAEQLPFGANMAVRTNLARTYPFSSQLGYRHGSLIPGEETAFFRAIRSSGGVGGWLPDARVQHRLPMSRATLKHVLNRAYGQGRADRIESLRTRQRSRWVVRAVAESSAKLVWTSLSGPAATTPVAIDLARHVGFFREALARTVVPR